MGTGYTQPMHGILLAGGMGTRMYPFTTAINKHTIPVYDKPLIYYPLTTLILAGIRDITILSTKSGVAQFKNMLGDGSQWGINLDYVIQEFAEGIAHGIRLAIKDKPDVVETLVILGDNIFFGSGLGRKISEINNSGNCHVWTQEVLNPESFGIAKLNDEGRVIAIQEKPKSGFGNMAITGLYYFPKDIFEKVKASQKSSRGEHEITGILDLYLKENRLEANNISRGVFWMDAGTIENLLEATQFVKAVQSRQGYLIGSPEEAAWQMGFLDSNSFEILMAAMPDSSYKYSLQKIIQKANI
jgi:glucose-1-phosphate thymidylyltransferase